MTVRGVQIPVAFFGVAVTLLLAFAGAMFAAGKVVAELDAFDRKLDEIQAEIREVEGEHFTDQEAVYLRNSLWAALTPMFRYVSDLCMDVRELQGEDARRCPSPTPTPPR